MNELQKILEQLDDIEFYSCRAHIMEIVHTPLLPTVGVSHNPEIKKKVFITPNAVPHIMTFGEATFKPGQSVGEHSHETMTEVFYIQSGRALFSIEGEDFEVQTGDCITIHAKERHAQSNPFDEDVVWLYFGVSDE